MVWFTGGLLLGGWWEGGSACPTGSSGAEGGWEEPRREGSLDLDELVSGQGPGKHVCNVS